MVCHIGSLRKNILSVCFLIWSSSIQLTTAYSRMTLDEIYSEMDNLASAYRDFVTVTSTQHEFNLPSSCKSGLETEHIGCANRYIVIEDPMIYSRRESITALQQRPDVFISGALHGDERVGPVAMIQTAKLLALAATCESGSTTSECDTFYTNFTPSQAGWLARLVATRRIVILPAANAKGYYFNSRYEKYVSDNGNISYIDPNRDFSFDNDPSKCMRSIVARSINELFLEYLFQMSLTYHGGIESISFEWGALSIPFNKVSPDDNGQRIMAKKMSQFAGELAPGKFYETGDMNDIVYGVHGGFEDWVYAGSWNSLLVSSLNVQCTPNTYGGYDISKTTYDDATLNTFNFLIETSNSKDPLSSKYGTDVSILNAPFLYDNNANNGYATKHVRTSLMAIDAAEPYVEIIGCNRKNFNKEYTPLNVLRKGWSKRFKKIRSRVGAKPRVRWNVGGSFTVDETFLLYGKWSDLPSNINDINQPSHSALVELMNNANFYKTSSQNGDTRWSDPTSTSIPSFKQRIKTNKFVSKDKIVIFAVAKVDQDWLYQPSNIWPNVGVKSHMTKIRTDPSYTKTRGSRTVQGHLYWVSVPLTMIVR